MKNLLLVLAICLPAASIAFSQEPAPVQNRPNVVLILADDLGINDLHCFGRTDHKTPNLDRLAAEGTRFTCAYCALPICSASRAGLLTSKHPARLHLTTFLSGRPDAPSQKLRQPRIEPALIPTEQTIAEVLKREGYATGLFGKWHLGAGDSAPAKQGFDTVFEPPANGDPAVSGGKNELLLMDKAIEFIRAQQDKPYFCYLAQNAPHIPLKEEQTRIDRNTSAWNPLYAATIERLDESIGGLLDAIEQSPRAKDTIVIFTSDNGGLHVPEGHREPATHNGNFRAGKGYLYEGGLRVPLIIRWPNGYADGETINSPVSLLDILPTIFVAAKINVSKTVGPIDGQSIAGLLSTDSAARQKAEKTAEERMFFWYLPHYTNQGSRPSGAVRQGKWKLIQNYETKEPELYDLSKDPGEQNDLYASAPKPPLGATPFGGGEEARKKLPEVVRIAMDFGSSLFVWREYVLAQELTPNPNFDADLHRKLYIDFDPAKLRGEGRTAEQLAKEWRPWREAMNKAVAGRKPVLNNTAAAILLGAASAKPHSKNLRYEPEPYKNVLGYWTEVDDWAEWQFDSPLEGKAEVQIHCGCQGGGSEVDLILKTPGAADQTLKWTVRNTGHFQNIVIETLGEVTLGKGKCTLEVRPRKKSGAAVTDIRQILLVPASP